MYSQPKFDSQYHTLASPGVITKNHQMCLPLTKKIKCILHNTVLAKSLSSFLLFPWVFHLNFVFPVSVCPTCCCFALSSHLDSHTADICWLFYCCCVSWKHSLQRVLVNRPISSDLSVLLFLCPNLFSLWQFTIGNASPMCSLTVQWVL